MSRMSSAQLPEPRSSWSRQARRGREAVTTTTTPAAARAPHGPAGPRLVLAQDAAADAAAELTTTDHEGRAAVNHNPRKAICEGRSRCAAVTGHQAPGVKTAVIPHRLSSAAGTRSAPHYRAGGHDNQGGSHARDAAVPFPGEVSADDRHWGPRRLPILRIVQRRLPRLAVILLITTVCAGCGSNAETVASYRPEFLPVALNINPSGISIEGLQSIVTPIGTFSIGALYDLPPRASGSIYVILRDRSTGFDKIFEVQTGTDQFMAVVNGTTNISIANGQVLIDITDGSIKQVAFERVSDQISQRSPNWFVKAWHVTVIRWIIIFIYSCA